MNKYTKIFECTLTILARATFVLSIITFILFALNLINIKWFYYSISSFLLLMLIPLIFVVGLMLWASSAMVCAS